MSAVEAAVPAIAEPLPIKAEALAVKAELIADVPAGGPPLAAPIESPATDAAEPASDADKQPQSERAGGHKRKVALFMAYVGAGYVVCLISESLCVVCEHPLSPRQGR